MYFGSVGFGGAPCGTRPWGFSALHHCAYFCQGTVMQYLLENAADPGALLQAVDNFGSTPLHVAARSGAKELCGLILKYARDPCSLLRQVNHAGKTPFGWTADFATTHFLCTYRKPVSLQWPDADAMICQDANHLLLGLSAQAAEEALVALAWKTYRRDEDDLHWVTSSCGDSFTSYDNCSLIKMYFTSRPGYHRYSMLEVMSACHHPGVGMADVFLSHAQREPVSLTLECMKQYELRREQSIRFFLDIYALRQCLTDFELPRVQEDRRSRSPTEGEVNQPAFSHRGQDCSADWSGTTSCDHHDTLGSNRARRSRAQHSVSS